MGKLIETFLAADYATLPAIMADTARPAAERKIAQCIYFFRLSEIGATADYAKADALIAQINSWHIGKPLVTIRTRDDFRTTTMGRTDIRRLLEDAASEEYQAAEWMALARQVAANPAIVAVAA